MVLADTAFVIYVVAMAALLMIYAGEQLAASLGAMQLPSLPGVFHYASDFANWLAGQFVSSVEAASTYVLGWAYAAIYPMVNWIDDYVAGVEHLWGAARDFADAVHGRFFKVDVVDIPNAVSAAVAASAEVTNAAIVRGVDAAIEQSIAWAQGEANTVWNNTVNLVDGQVGQLQTEIGGIEAAVQALPAEIEAAATTTLGQAINWAQGEANTVWSNAVALVGGQREAIDGVIGGIQTSVQALELEIEQQIGTINTSITAEAAIAAAATAAVAITFDDWLTGCGDNLCTNLGGLGNLIGDLATLFEIGALMAWIAYCAHDPAGAAQDTESFAGAMARDAADAVMSTVGAL